jgi:acetoin utilization protein AcuB
MKVREWMIRNPVTVSKDQGIRDCVDLMKDFSIRHLPVVENQKLVGLVTESDLREVSSASSMEHMTVESVMIPQPITVSPDTDIEDAARLIYFNKIGGLPVVDDDQELIGIITVMDLLEVFIDLMGVMKSSSRIDIILGDDPEAFERVSALIRAEGGEIISVGISGADSKTERIYFFRLEKCDVEHITRVLQDAGFVVVSSAA